MIADKERKKTKETLADRVPAYREDPQEELDRKRKCVHYWRRVCQEKPDSLAKGSWFPGGLYESISLGRYYGTEDGGCWTRAFVDKGCFYMLHSWWESCFMKSDDDGDKILWLDEENTAKMQAEFDTDFFADLYARFGAETSVDHHSWTEIKEFLGRKGIKYETVTGNANLYGLKPDEIVAALKATQKPKRSN